MDKEKLNQTSADEIQRTDGSKERIILENRERARERLRIRRARGKPYCQGAQNWKSYKFFSIDSQRQQVRVN